MNHGQRARRHNQAAIRRARECRDGALDLAGVAYVDRADLHPDRRRHGLDYGELADPRDYSRITKDRRSRYTRRDLFKQFQPFPTQIVFELHKTGGVAARPGQAINKTRADRVGDVYEYDWHNARRLQQWRHD